MSAPAHIARENGKKGGRPKAGHTIATEQLRAFVIEQVRQNAQPLLNAKLALALGHKRVVTTRTGKDLIYDEPPDATSIQYLLNQAVGKPTETLKVEEDIRLKIDV